ncbi:MAG: type II toxin-antitoxin system mRNA interferase toxin, RelE/StbE family [Prolixibacteraceae bacterium]|jgi:mRNA-degrading endonuclease YafQ of YafQ-DinJ toxin-antitoxin module|nr:type II toxin-antitoxin system mRNA interferase toxin, RelE/StbE family [Prolixibacteraceae bacterium]MBT6764585.1 type II toxin-antitoxin system mRNA interferase toxin, RelE/StbE family [Prolixibacteraceae bacterium]MBT7000791.1 type II toxin-antitoxin system mRNA interferase toxin, RelE/StbE family [Prolixibacteraceae bacterium]MBT7393572.1 type II toxin-antitoxin system mRNA interferase toxin, RelE/StbE family [Prolixibacteraceae bacterium]
MEVAFSTSFRKSYKKRIESTNLEPLFWERLQLFIENPFNINLKTHKLSGKLRGAWSFSITYDLRVVFKFTKDSPKRAILIDIGNHDEVY